MTRKSTINLNYGNSNKDIKLREFISEYTRIVNIFINLLWDKQVFSGCFISKDFLYQATWLSARAKQCAGKQALQIVKSQRKKKNKTKPVFSGNSIELDSRFIEIQKGTNSFDIWIKISSLGKKIVILIPSKRHYHFNKFETWTMKKSARLRIDGKGKMYLDVFFDKTEKEKKSEGESVGLDCGYKKLAVLSNGNVIGRELQNKIENISRKLQKSKGFNRALIERNEYINKEIKQIKLDNVKEMVVEDLKNVKHGTKGKIRKEFNNKLQRWVYSYFLNRLEQHCEVVGVQLHKVNPAYTSQTCFDCGDVHRANRNGELFKCRSCGYTADADYNASLNILNRFRPQVHMVPVHKN
ncbi:MAG: transposase [Nitrospirae bacterium]|uniref:RNA-guided endonuclease InsQ/TnpB family protein n=1 Tax=Candidatus Magnetobacterium casense TaxID=1455061 RepID=UPI000696D2D2|nr:RNA-guided endonuclease TnpB family protein [Candidatus Magnetobacterium casensis]MBF0337817.1 transposase [Nitrospirota bacterium]